MSSTVITFRDLVDNHMRKVGGRLVLHLDEALAVVRQNACIGKHTVSRAYYGIKIQAESAEHLARWVREAPEFKGRRFDLDVRALTLAPTLAQYRAAKAERMAV